MMFRACHPVRSQSVRLLAWLVAACLPVAVIQAQDPLQTLPNNYRSVFENDEVRVIRAHYGPFEKVPVHDHPGIATIFVYLSNSSPVRIDHQGGSASSVVRPPTVTGAFRVAAAQAERHSIENLGGQSSDFLRVELKQISFPAGEAFRGGAPQSLQTPLDAIEFSEAGVQVERIVCAAGSQCGLKPSPTPSLLVAFTNFSVRSGASQEEEGMEAGAIDWLHASQEETVSANSGSPAHLLRIILPPAQAEK